MCNVFIDQCDIWWTLQQREKFMTILIKMFDKACDQSYLNDILYTIKEAMSHDFNLKDKKALLTNLNSLLKPKEVEKKRYGEVFTPLTLVEDMLGKLPQHVWSDPSLKWFDPAVGIGNFMVCVYYRLMQGLQEVFPDEDKRHAHIIENMLYMSELNSKNVFVCKRIFGSSANIHQGDTLCFEPLHEEFGIAQFDIIVGNPPYQDSTSGKRDGGYGGRTLWDKFVRKSLDVWLAHNGYLCYVHPSNWRKPEHELWEYMTSRQILHLDIHSKKEGSTVFRAATRFDWYVIQQRSYTDATHIRDEEGISWNIDLRKWKFLPNGAYDVMERCFDFTNTFDTFKVIYSRTSYGTDKKNVKTTECEEFKYKVIHNMTKKGIGYVYTNDSSKGHFGQSKVILTFGEFQYPVNDYEGNYGMSQITYGLPINSKDEGDLIIDAIKSDQFKRILVLTKWNTFYTEWRMFNYLRRDFMRWI